jgi:O-glycosyl hydrolase
MMNPSVRIGLVFWVVAAWGCAIASTPVEVIEVLPSQRLQTIEGFGASGAWWAQSIGTWPKDTSDPILKLLYDAQEGIGLTIYRYNIGAGSGDDIKDPWRSAETFEVSRGVYDWTRDAPAVRVLNRVCELGAERVILFANSPPVRMTGSGYAYAAKDTGVSNLRKEMYAEFATYLADIAEHFIKQKNVPVYAVSPINEPQWKWDTNKQEGCHYKPDEAARLIKLMIEEVNRRKLDIKVDAPESGSWQRQEHFEENGKESQLDYLDALFKDEDIRNSLDDYVLHSYWSKPEDKKIFADYFYKTYPDKKLHMSEWCQMKGGRDDGMESALALANEIMDDLTIGKVSSWQCWIAVSKYNYHDGLIYVDDTAKTFQTTKRLWAMGNFSKFIRPGFRQVQTAHNLQEVKLFAAQSPDESELVLVVINNTKNSVELKLKLPGNLKFDESVSVETSEHHDLRMSPARPPTDHYTFAPESVTTVQLTRTHDSPVQ